MAARIGSTIGLALLAATWIVAALPGRVRATPASRPAAAKSGEAARAARLRAGARAWIQGAAAHQRRA